MTYLLTASGLKFDLTNPCPEMIDIEDIALALSREPRFIGHTQFFYSVAAHSLMAAVLAPRKFKLEALLHDAAEAYLKDIPTPLKALLPEYRTIEARVDAVIRRKFGLPEVCSPEVARIDRVLLATEKRDLMPPDDAEWPGLVGVSPCPEHVKPAKMEDVRHTFLTMYRELKS
jgi:hypothetical protein